VHISHDFIATKTCPSYEFFVVFGQVRVWDQKSWARGGRGLEVCRAEADTRFQPAQDSMLTKLRFGSHL